MKKLLYGFLGVLVLGAAIVWFTIGGDLYAMREAMGRHNAPADYALQDDTKVNVPDPEPRVVQPRNPLKNVYWGDTHVHTHESFDAALFGTTLSIEDAYRFARGEALRSDGGERMQLSRPLDFVAITDHAEGFGTRTRCSDPNLTCPRRRLGTPTQVYCLNRGGAGVSNRDPTPRYSHVAGTRR